MTATMVVPALIITLVAEGALLSGNAEAASDLVVWQAPERCSAANPGRATQKRRPLPAAACLTK
jgi:hypothetical protein